MHFYKNPFKISLLAFLLFSASSLFAKVENVEIQASNAYMSFSWSPVDQSTLSQVEGYAVQWSVKSGDISINSPANLYLNSDNQINLRRGSFKNDTTYYLRIYTYVTNSDNRRLLGNGSERIEWEVTSRHQILNKKSVVISETDTTTSSRSNHQLKNIRTLIYDDFAELYWSKPNFLGIGEYDGFLFEISTDRNFKEDVQTLSINNKKYSLRIKGLKPNTTYYLKSFFYKNIAGEDRKLGSSNVKSFKTITAIPRDSRSKKSRNIIRIEKKAITTLSLDGSTSPSQSTQETTPASSQTLTQQAPETANSQTTNQTSSSDTNDIRQRIRQIQTQIASLNKELKKLEEKLKITKTSRPKEIISLSKRKKISKRRASILSALKKRRLQKRAR